MKKRTVFFSKNIARRLLLVAGLLLVLVLVLFAVIRMEGALPQVSATPSSNPSPFDASRAMDLYFIDVGQGDAILVRSPSGRIMLIDAGPEDAAEAVLSQLEQVGATKIDCLIATHSHEDHIGAMAKVLGKYPVSAAFFPRDAKAEDYGDLFSLLDQQGVSPTLLTASLTSMIDFDPSIEVRVLSPFDVQYEDENERSVVLRIGYENTSVLLTGDAGALSERLMLKALPNHLFAANVLKLGHHGSYSSTTEKFLKAVSPGLAIVSCGRDNPYGHPDPNIVALLQKQGIPLLSTADYGTLHLMLDGVRIRVVE